MSNASSSMATAASNNAASLCAISVTTTLYAAPYLSIMCNLPLDILFEVFFHLSAVDIVALLSTCKALHAHINEVYLWRHLAARYNLFDISVFSGLSFYAVYTQLLHPYGPLIGLWASDHPYRGNILEFRLVAAAEGQPGGIVGEVWHFPDPEFGDDMEVPHVPSYVPILKICFSTPTSSINDTPDSSTVRILCYPYVPVGNLPSTEELHKVTIEVVPSTDQSIFLQRHRRTSSHPEFPAHSAPWYDTTRGLPHLTSTSDIRHDQSEIVRIFPAVRLPVIFTAPSTISKPAALSVHCSNRTCAHLELQQPRIPYDDLVPTPPRYYPLRAYIQRGVDPRAPDWHPSSLAGLWLGAYGPHGTECLFLEWAEEEEVVRAWKLTGDMNVPRGAQTWVVRMNPRNPMSCVFQFLTTTFLEREPATKRIHLGSGTVKFGEPCVELVVGFTEPDTIKVWWDRVSDMRTYTRYRGRDDTEDR